MRPTPTHRGAALLPPRTVRGRNGVLEVGARERRDGDELDLLLDEVAARLEEGLELGHAPRDDDRRQCDDSVAHQDTIWCRTIVPTD